MDGMTDASVPFDSDCIDARLSYPDSFQEMPNWALQAVEELKSSSRRFLAVAYPFLVDGSTAYEEAVSANMLLQV